MDRGPTAGVVTGLVLAAGAGRRLGQPKAQVVVGGVRLVDRAVRLLREGGCDDVLVVVRSSSVEVPDARTVLNPSPDEGMGSSLRVGLAELSRPGGDDDAQAGTAACLIVLADQVGITPAEVAEVIGRYRAGAAVVVARRAGKRSHPVLVSRELFADFTATAVGDRGARVFIDAHSDDVSFLDFDSQIEDIDTPADLAAINARY